MSREAGKLSCELILFASRSYSVAFGIVAIHFRSYSIDTASSLVVSCGKCGAACHWDEHLVTFCPYGCGQSMSVESLCRASPYALNGRQLLPSFYVSIDSNATYSGAMSSS